MPTIAVNDIEICFESFGDDDAPPVLLVMGLGAQMTLWTIARSPLIYGAITSTSSLTHLPRIISSFPPLHVPCGVRYLATRHGVSGADWC